MLDYTDQSLGLDEIVFEERNRDYGAYELRKRYERRIRTAALWASSGLAALVLIPLLMLNGQAGIRKNKEVVIVFEPKSTMNKTPETPKAAPSRPKAPPAAPKPPVETRRFTPPEIALHPEDAQELLPQDSLKDRALGIEDSGGGKPDGGNSQDQDTQPGGDGPGGPGGDTDGGAGEPANRILDFAEVLPTAPYDYNLYIRDHLRYPPAALDNAVKGTMTLQFVVDRDGSIQDVKVLKSLGYGLDEEAQKVLSEMPAWKPGTQGGTAVPVRVRIPLRFEVR